MLLNDSNGAARRSLRAAAIGNALEWFDWTLYGLFSSSLAESLFKKTDPHSALLSVLAVFAGGFVARPIGGWLFGKIGDVFGRKTTLVITMSTLAASSIAMALIPAYENVGLLASALLLVFRLIQGLAHGGESGVSYTYITEIAPARRRGLWSSSVYVSVTVGVMAATALAALISSTLSREAMNAYGWRLGFAVGGLLGLYALFLRRSAVESEIFEDVKREQEHETRRLTPQQMLRVSLNIIMICAAANATYYSWFTFAPSVAISRGMNASVAYTISLFSQALCLIWLPLAGWMSDRYGRKVTIVVWGIAVVILTYPISIMIGNDPRTFLVAQILGLAAWSIITSIYPAVLAEQVPTYARARGVGLVTSISVAIFGGTAPYLNAYTASTSHQHAYIVYVMVLGAFAILAGLTIHETAGVEISDIDARFEHETAMKLQLGEGKGYRTSEQP